MVQHIHNPGTSTKESKNDQKLFFIQRRLKAKIIRKNWRNIIYKYQHVENVSPTPAWASAVRRIKRRNGIYREIVESERAYLASLRLIMNVWQNPLEEYVLKQKQILEEVEGDKIVSDELQLEINMEEIITLFGNIKMIKQFHEILCNDFERAFLEWPTKGSILKIGGLIVALIPYMKLYTHYINHYSRSLSLLSVIRSSRPKLDFWIENQRKVARDKVKDLTSIEQNTKENKEAAKIMELSHYLIMPVQRIPRYILLIKELVEHTDPSEALEENKVLHLALEGLQKI